MLPATYLRRNSHVWTAGFQLSGWGDRNKIDALCFFLSIANKELDVTNQNEHLCLEVTASSTYTGVCRPTNS